ncbi:lipopolysaccharide assembly protein LapB [Endozoicomonas sp. ISHI1]|uniref:tetratricopeptide repeat protein n=2 Tax=unclassified Endozoicomonas TaxID=2644528 RepID=UPI002148F397|nr:hypothetical protein [Endozoicomonas sp. ISHI1]
MSYGLPPAYGSASQPSQHRLPESHQDTDKDRKPASKLDPNAPLFVPRDSWDDRSSARSSAMPQTLRHRQTSAHRASFSQRPHPSTNKQSTVAAKQKVDQAFKALKKQHFTDAEKQFLAILEECPDELSQSDYQNSVIGLARSLKEQNREKQIKACTRLEELRLKGHLTALRASKIHHLDLTLSLCEQALGWFPKAEERLIRLRNIKPDADEEILCQHSNYFDADMANARLWSLMDKHQMTETLLVNMKTELTRKLQSNQCPASAEHFHKRLQIVNITLVRLLQERGLYEWAEKLLFDISDKSSNDSEDCLCKASGNNEIDLALARLWQLMEKNEQAEKLLLSVSGKSPNASEEILCRPFGDLDIDLALSRHWQNMGKNHLSEKLLLNMSSKHQTDSVEKLCRVSGKRVVDLNLALLWQSMEKLELCGKLLLNMSGKRPGSSEEILCQPCGDYGIDLALVRYWEQIGQYKMAEKLLLNMIGKHPGLNKEILCQPCGNHTLDLTLARLWQTMGKNEWTERLLLNMSHKHPNDNEERLCKPSGKKDVDVALARNWEVQGKYTLTERLLLNMADKSPFAGEEALCKRSGNLGIDLTLVRFWGRTGDYKRAEKLLVDLSGKNPEATEDLLCKACGNPLVDLALVRIWELMGKHTRAEKLLLDASGKQPDDTEEDLCKPCGNHYIDLALVLLWQVMDKNERAQRLIHRCCDLYHTSECELALLTSYVGEARFMELITGYQESANTLLSTSIHYFKLASQQIEDNDPAGQDNLKKALEYVESALEKYPPSAGAYSQKAHCLRMMGYPENEWQEWFRKAETLDPSRVERFKANDVWRINEARAVEKLKHQARRT